MWIASAASFPTRATWEMLELPLLITQGCDMQAAVALPALQGLQSLLARLQVVAGGG